MSGTELELRIARTGQEYPALPVTLIREWIAQGRVTREDLVRPSGARNWLKISLAPELLDEPAITTEFTELDLFDSTPTTQRSTPTTQRSTPTTRTTPTTPPTPTTQPGAATGLGDFRQPQPARPAQAPKPNPTQPATTKTSGPSSTVAGQAAAPARTTGAATAGRAASVFAGSIEPTGADVATSLDNLGIAAPAYRRRTKKRPPLEDSVLDLTPMIDVTFQLLIFFMVTNTLSEAVPIEVPRAVYGRGVSPNGMQSILITDKSEYYLGDSVDPQALASSLDALVEEVSKSAQAAENPLEVIISAHRASKHLDVRLLMERLGAINNMGAIRLGVEEEP